MRRNRFHGFSLMVLVAVLAVSAVGLAWAAEPAKKAVDESDGLAMRGYDAVAYVTEGAPVKGDARFSREWRGSTWRFRSAENRDRFAANPEAYAPAYGGYCAWAVGHDYTAPGDPEAWTVAGGRLFLNYSVEIRDKWLPDRDKWIAAGDLNWPAVLEKGD